MVVKQIVKRCPQKTPKFYELHDATEVKKENKNIKEEDMIGTEDIKKAAKLSQELNPSNVKRIKKDKGLIERTESSKIILEEDNRQLLND